MATFVLSLAPGVNNLYRNARSRAGKSIRIKTPKYAAWIRGELAALVAQRARPVHSPVAICLTLPSTMRGDMDGRFKATIDLLVRAGIIPNDDKSVVRSLTASFADIKMMHVAVSTIEDVS